jgi:iron complex outermembrane receptor protein
MKQSFSPSIFRRSAGWIRQGRGSWLGFVFALAGAIAPAGEPGAVSRSAAAGSAGFGAIEGRVFNADLGNYVNNARVMVDGLRLETFTDEYGNYTFPRVPAGAATVRVVYTGFPAIAQAVTVEPGGRAEGNFTLRADQSPSGNTVVLDAFTVAAARDMAASDIAVNEQRYFAGIKNVVAADSFGDIAEGNVGEFAKFLPGVTLARNGSDGVNISLGGVPPSSTPIMVDGNSLASASSSNASRTVELEQVSITSMSRVEITRSQNPDSPANAIGGTVNLVSKSAFERRRPEYALKTYLSFRGGDFSLAKEPNPFNKRDYPFEPNVEFSAVVPVTKNFGFTASGLVTRALNNGQGSLMTWVPNGAAQSANFPATSVEQPYLVRYRLQERPKITVRENVSLSADWRVSARGVLTFGFQYAYYTSAFWVRQLHFDVGRVASFGPDFTQGAAGAGFAQIIYDAREKTGTTYMPSFRYKHNGAVWQWQTGGAFSRASNHYRALDKGYFQSNNAYFRNLTLRFEQMGFDHPGVVAVSDAAGRAVDPYTLSNYRLESLSSLKSDSADIVRSVYASAKRDFNLRVPLSLKTGIDFRSQSRDMRRPTFNTAYVGADRAAQTADDNAAQWYDPVYGERDMLYGPKMQWIDLSKIGNTFRANPEYFSQSAANAVTDYRNGVTTSQAITETIAAPYLRLDTRLLDGRLQLTGGVRYEHTKDVGDGPLIDPTRIYQRNASGQIVRDAAGRPVVIAALATLAGTQLAYIERAASVEKAYAGFYPSLNGSYLIRPNLIARFSYGHSISRPDFGNILPSANLPDPEGTGRTITLTNPALKPWSADSYGVALEYYFNEPSTGVLSARLYRRDIQDFWGSSLQPATAELLEPWGLDPAVYGEALGYLVSTQVNVGKARVSGMEYDYRQNLAFLPRWARGFTVFGNMTLQHLEGSQRASFGGFVAKTTNYGITYSRARFTARLAVNLKGTVRQGQITNAGTEPGTFTYLRPRHSADLSAEYRVTRRFAVFASGRNINEAIDDTVIYGPRTPPDRSLSGRADYRAYWNVGLKGTF